MQIASSIPSGFLLSLLESKSRSEHSPQNTYHSFPSSTIVPLRPSHICINSAETNVGKNRVVAIRTNIPSFVVSRDSVFSDLPWGVVITSNLVILRQQTLPPAEYAIITPIISNTVLVRELSLRSSVLCPKRKQCGVLLALWQVNSIW